MTGSDSDPYEDFNRSNYSFNDNLDSGMMVSAANFMNNKVSVNIRSGLTNFYNNLLYPNTILNDFLQGKLTQGVSDVTRLLVNSTIGLGGILDVGSQIGLASHDEDLGQTLAVWGIDSGPYLYLPLFGPGTVRESPDIIVRNVINPMLYLDPVVAIPVIALYWINLRANVLRQTEIRDESAVDSYIFTREAYMQQREFLIYDGEPPVESYDDLFDL